VEQELLALPIDLSSQFVNCVTSCQIVSFQCSVKLTNVVFSALVIITLFKCHLQTVYDVLLSRIHKIELNIHMYK